VESKDLSAKALLSITKMRRFFDSLRSLRMTCVLGFCSEERAFPSAAWNSSVGVPTHRPAQIPAIDKIFKSDYNYKRGKYL